MNGIVALFALGVGVSLASILIIALAGAFDSWKFRRQKKRWSDSRYSVPSHPAMDRDAMVAALKADIETTRQRMGSSAMQHKVVT